MDNILEIHLLSQDQNNITLLNASTQVNYVRSNSSANNDLIDTKSMSK